MLTAECHGWSVMILLKSKCYIILKDSLPLIYSLKLSNHRTTVISFACYIGVPACLNAVGEEFTRWIANPEVRPDPDLRTIIYSYGMRTRGDEASWNIVWDLYLKETDAAEKQKLMGALNNIQVPWILKRLYR